MPRKTFAALVFLVFFSVAPAHAAEILWILDDVSSPDGAMLSGSFQFNTITDETSNAHITDTAFPGVTFTNGGVLIETGFFNRTLGSFSQTVGSPPVFDLYNFHFQLDGSDPLAGTANISLNSQGSGHSGNSESPVEGFEFYAQPLSGQFDYGGNVSATPLPSSVVMFASALLALLALLAFVGHRKFFRA